MPKPVHSKTVGSIEQELSALRQELIRQNDWRHRMFLGAIHGLGTVIGATILAGLILYLIVHLLDRIGMNQILTILSQEGILQIR